MIVLYSIIQTLDKVKSIKIVIKKINSLNQAYFVHGDRYPFFNIFVS